jgi:uncharacterized membrane protein YfcA
MHFGEFDLAALLPFIAVGFAAQLVDGALGMAFGVISSTLLVGVLGVPPALASQRVHVVECFTTGVSGISHLLHRNIDGRLFLRLVVPGVIGGFAGAYLLSNIDAAVVKPFVLLYLTAIGLFLLIQGADPRKVVGTVSAVEFFLTVTISAAFIYHLGVADLAGATLGLLIGGILAAPLGAWAAKHFPAKQMLILVGIVLTLTSAYGVWSAWG